MGQTSGGIGGQQARIHASKKNANLLRSAAQVSTDDRMVDRETENTTKGEVILCDPRTHLLMRSASKELPGLCTMSEVSITSNRAMHKRIDGTDQSKQD